jgi:putative copper export protein
LLAGEDRQYGARGMEATRLFAWVGVVNPLHVLGASLWLGTLFVLVVCGVREMLEESVSPPDREANVVLALTAILVSLPSPRPPAH